MKHWALLALAGLGMCPAFAETSREIYVSSCTQAVEAIPDFSCADGEIVPVTVNGVVISSADFKPGMECDRPSLLDNGAGSDGQCVPGSRILDHSTDKTQISVMCRQKHNRPEATLLFDEIDVIAHNPRSGATCWFQAEAADQDHPLDGRHVVSPTTILTSDIWKTPEAVARDGCGNCHDNDPFMYSPFAGQVWYEVPTNPFGPYWHVGAGLGFEDWPTEVFALRDNTCLGCHRIGTMATSKELTEWMVGAPAPPGSDPEANTFPVSHSMPPDHELTLPAWHVLHSKSVADILFCHDNPTEQSCNLTQLPNYTQR
ncbi:MAG: hypothetical protein AAGF36_01205 [Pseudomonadota bacterium]